MHTRCQEWSPGNELKCTKAFAHAGAHEAKKIGPSNTGYRVVWTATSEYRTSINTLNEEENAND